MIIQPWKIYCAKLKRSIVVEGLPKTVMKIGITSSSDAMRRLTYKGADEPFPIVDTFDDIKIMHSGWAPNREKAESIEQLIMNTIGKGSRFHNWYEPKQLSGITEMRLWNYDEFLEIISLMNKHCVSFNEAQRVANLGNLLETF